MAKSAIIDSCLAWLNKIFGILNLMIIELSDYWYITSHRPWNREAESRCHENKGVRDGHHLPSAMSLDIFAWPSGAWFYHIAGWMLSLHHVYELYVMMMLFQTETTLQTSKRNKRKCTLAPADYHLKYEHILGRDVAKDSARVASANVSYGFG